MKNVKYLCVLLFLIFIIFIKQVTKLNFSKVQLIYYKHAQKNQQDLFVPVVPVVSTFKLLLHLFADI